MTPQIPRNERWPLWASALGGSHARLILEALNDPAIIAVMGWYTDTLAAGPIWHRWAHLLQKDLSPCVGMACISALYSLASHGLVEFTTTAGSATPRVIAVAATLPDGIPERSVERAIFGVSHATPGAPLTHVLENVIPRVGLRRRARHEAWLKRHDVHLDGHNGSPERVMAALELAGRFVELETGGGLAGTEADDLEDLLSVIEMATFRYLER